MPFTGRRENGAAVHFLVLDDVQLELVRRETMKQAASDLRHLAEHLDQLALLAPWPAGAIHDDVRTSRSIAEESLGTLDALGWPKDADHAQGA